MKKARSASYLILTVDGQCFSRRAPLGDHTIARQAASLAETSGYELVRNGPLEVRAYTSYDPRGVGRVGSQVYSFAARKLYR